MSAGPGFDPGPGFDDGWDDDSGVQGPDDATDPGGPGHNDDPPCSCKHEPGCELAPRKQRWWHRFTGDEDDDERGR